MSSLFCRFSVPVSPHQFRCASNTETSCLLVRVATFTIRSMLTAVQSAGQNVNLVIADEVFASVGFFSLLNSAYVLVLDRWVWPTSLPISYLSDIQGKNYQCVSWHWRDISFKWHYWQQDTFPQCCARWRCPRDLRICPSIIDWPNKTHNPPQNQPYHLPRPNSYSVVSMFTPLLPGENRCVVTSPSPNYKV